MEQKKVKKEKENYSKFKQVEDYLTRNYDLRFNIVSNQVELKFKKEKEWQVANENNIYRDLRLKNISFSRADLSALLGSNFVNEYDPLQLYFELLPAWDGNIDYINELANHIITSDVERFRKHFKKMFVRCVSCSLGQSVNKQAFVFLGGQNSGKTTLLRWLCPEILKEYYAENISVDKDGLISLTENFIINQDELASLQRFEINNLKSMISKENVKIRRPFEKKATIARRRANFFGSTNKEEFLNDETGSVRWLCFEILKINHDYRKKININNVWAQAYSLYQSDFKFDLDLHDIEENEQINSTHQIRTPEMEILQKYFSPAKKEDEGAEGLTATEILNRIRVMGLTTAQLAVQAIGKALKMLGFQQSSERMKNSKMPLKVYWLIFKNE